eukprot:TRINITY_DN32884_c0_g1_i1.p1 TRINITY_DN32884_c0_g1~~TRINITY_DN32884_c0_g1_i1.p1  ORF type:complete len:315 (-),score=79.75 TRINITY_DN32884_c0_g1_i1:521-1465(-)
MKRDEKENFVMVTAVTILKILKHSSDHNPPQKVRGDLYGMEEEGRLEVTNCFPSKLVEDGENAEHAQTAFRDDVSKMFGKCNVDENRVGVYYVTWHDHIDPALVDDIIQLLPTEPRAVLLLFDPFATAQRRRLALRAVRPTQRLVEGWQREGRYLAEDVNLSTMFEEVPVKLVSGACLVSVFIAQLALSMATAVVPPPLAESVAVGDALTNALESAHEAQQSASGRASDYQLSLRRYVQSQQPPIPGQRRFPAQPPSRVALLHELNQLTSLCTSVQTTAATALRDAYASHELATGKESERSSVGAGERALEAER